MILMGYVYRLKDETTMTPCLHGACTVTFKPTFAIASSDKSMPRKGQRTITITEGMYGEIERIVGDHKVIFDSPTQFAKHAIRELIIKLRAGKK